MAPPAEPRTEGAAYSSYCPSFVKFHEDSSDNVRFGDGSAYGHGAMPPPPTDSETGRRSRRSTSRPQQMDCEDDLAARNPGHQRSSPRRPCATPCTASAASGRTGRQERDSVHEDTELIDHPERRRSDPCHSKDETTKEHRNLQEECPSQGMGKEFASHTTMDASCGWRSAASVIPVQEFSNFKEDEDEVMQMFMRQAGDHARQLQELRLQRDEEERVTLEQDQLRREEDEELRRTHAQQAQEQRLRQEEELRQVRAQRRHEEEKLRRLKEQREHEISHRRSEEVRPIKEVRLQEDPRLKEQDREERRHAERDIRRSQPERRESGHAERRRQTREHVNSMLDEGLRRREEKELRRLEAQREEELFRHQTGEEELRRLKAQRDEDLMRQREREDLELQKLRTQKEQELVRQQDEEARLLAEEQRRRKDVERGEEESRYLNVQRKQELMWQQSQEAHHLAEEQRWHQEHERENEELQLLAFREQEYLQQQAVEARIFAGEQLLLEQQQREMEHEEVIRLQAQQEEQQRQRKQTEEGHARAEEERARQEREQLRQEKEAAQRQAVEEEQGRLEETRAAARAEEERCRHDRESATSGPEAEAQAAFGAWKSAPPEADNGAGDEVARTSAPLISASFYEVLEIQHNALAEDIRKAYKKQCVRHHPDKGGDRDRFDQIQQAYHVLADPRLRKAYNKSGFAGVEAAKAKEQRSQQNSQAQKQTQKQQQAQPIVAEALVPLEIAYTGGSVEVQVVRIVNCQRCTGTGVEPGGGHVRCPGCQGQGAEMQYMQLGAMVLEQRVPCGLCSGAGSVLPFECRCAGCGGEQLVEEEAVVPFDIPPGLAPKERLVQRGQGHVMPGLASGDVVLVCRVQNHDRFMRKGDDLLAEQLVPLQMALCGGALVTPHLGGRSVNVRLPCGAVVAPGVVKCVPGEGMPKRHNPHLRGDLVLRFAIEFPISLPEEVAARLESAFIGHPREEAEVPPSPGADNGEVYLADFNMEEFGKTLQQAAKEVHDSEDEENAGHEGVARRTGRAQFPFEAHPFIFSPYAAGSGGAPSDYGHAAQACRQM